MDADNNSKVGKRKAPRHTPHQIQHLKAFFKECRNPNENQKRQLSRELGLGQNQIKFWFQNKRNQREFGTDQKGKCDIYFGTEGVFSKIQDSLRAYSWRFPSGLMIESLSNGKSKWDVLLNQGPVNRIAIMPMELILKIGFQLSRFFGQCPNPNDNQERQLSRNLGLDEKQVRLWFQNKRNQIKIHNDDLDNSALRSENERLQSENLAISEVIKNDTCSACDVHPPVGEEERRLNIEKLRRENALLRDEYERIANE